jgi:hypothetical protein
VPEDDQIAERIAVLHERVGEDQPELIVVGIAPDRALELAVVADGSGYSPIVDPSKGARDAP